ncbi:MAG: glycoside hydrolase family 57 protein, partial [Gammaproteobacteria bacterium]|nr:glycoside hydrolase family 57 protein [Gammaproteobacteria bacterium]
FTPYAHPIIPLMLDLKSAEEAMPKVHLPATAQYPGGEQRSLWHIERGIEVFEQFFKRKPDGCWPSEGSVSDATLRLCDKMGIRWIASGENVMRNSLAKNQKLKSELENECTHRPYKINDCNTVCFFRDDGLSDLIGFTYSDWHADDAVNNFIHHLENIYKACKNPQDSVVSVILDGENAWEHYPENGYYFLSTLYKRLTEHPHIQLTTFSKVLDENTNPVNLNHITAGSWVYGTFSTWIGDPDKNKGWDLLIAAKHVYDRVLERGELSEEQRRLATQQLAICEGSDWFWWFGDYNPAASVNDFDRLYRYQLKELYKLLKEPIPPELDSPISVGGGTPEGGGAMRRGSEV